MNKIEVLKTVQKSILRRAWVYVAIGLTGILMPEVLLSFLILILSFTAIFLALNSFQIAFLMRKQKGMLAFIGVQAFLELLLGVLVLLFPNFFLQVGLIALGIWFVISGIWKIGYAVFLSKEVVNTFEQAFFASLFMLLGAWIIWENSFEALKLGIFFVCMIIVASSISLFFQAFRIQKAINRFDLD